MVEEREVELGNVLNAETRTRCLLTGFQFEVTLGWVIGHADLGAVF